jgi:thiamine kinase
MQIEAILDTWRAWEAPLRTRPRIIGPLGGGRSNRSFLLESNGFKMVLRINAKDDLLPNRRDGEAKIWAAASAAGIAPPLLHADPDGAFLVSAYVENALPQHPENDVALIGRVFDLLQRCHRLEVNVPAIDYAAHIEAYWQIIWDRRLAIEPELQAQRGPLRRLLEELVNSATVPGLCHHDPVQDNFVGAPGKLFLIDWEYAARGLPVMDYAAFAVEWGLDDATISKHSGFDTESLAKAKTFYRYQCRLWEVIA